MHVSSRRVSFLIRNWLELCITICFADPPFRSGQTAAEYITRRTSSFSGIYPGAFQIRKPAATVVSPFSIASSNDHSIAETASLVSYGRQPPNPLSDQTQDDQKPHSDSQSPERMIAVDDDLKGPAHPLRDSSSLSQQGIARASPEISPPSQSVTSPSSRTLLAYDERMLLHREAPSPFGREHPERPDRVAAIWHRLTTQGERGLVRNGGPNMTISHQFVFIPPFPSYLLKQLVPAALASSSKSSPTGHHYV